MLQFVVLIQNTASFPSYAYSEVAFATVVQKIMI